MNNTEMKINQAYEMAGLARIDRDYKDELRWLKEAKRLERELLPPPPAQEGD